jgi:two-component system, chemotaxis family, chemotaxis protein CheY
MADPQTSKTILIVDDASLVRLYYKSALQAAGFRVEEALNGIEALEKLLEMPAPVDLLIVDINMPQMDGLTFLGLLRQKHLPLAAIPALVTSTEARESDFAAARTAGANYFLVKPVAPEVLVEHARLLCGVRHE